MTSTLVDVLGSDPDLVPDRVATLVEFDALVRHIKELAGKERQVIELRYGLRGPRRTQREIARMLGISRSYVSRIDMTGAEGTKGAGLRPERRGERKAGLSRRTFNSWQFTPLCSRGGWDDGVGKDHQDGRTRTA